MYPLFGSKASHAGFVPAGIVATTEFVALLITETEPLAKLTT